MCGKILAQMRENRSKMNGACLFVLYKLIKLLDIKY